MEKSESIENQFSSLADGQQAVIKELATEEDPFNPDRTKTAIADAAGVHDSYVGKVVSQHQDIIEHLHTEIENAEFIDTESPSTENSTESDTSENNSQVSIRPSSFHHHSLLYHSTGHGARINNRRAQGPCSTRAPARSHQPACRLRRSRAPH